MTANAETISSPAPAAAASEAAVNETINAALEAVLDQAPAPAPRKARKPHRRRHNASNVVKRGGCYYLNVIIDGKKIRKSLGRDVTEKSAAVAKADQAIADLMAKRWDRVWGTSAHQAVPTVQEVIDRYMAARDLSSNDRVRHRNCNYLVQMVATVRGISDEAARKERLSVLSSNCAYEYQRKMLDRSFKGPLDRNSACVSINAALRGIRALFTKDALDRDIFKGMNLDNRNAGSSKALAWIKNIAEFKTAKKLKELPNDKYEPPPAEEVATVWRAVTTELVKTDPEAFVAFWIAGMTGLRAGEIRQARWGWFRDGAVDVRKTENWVPKGKRERTVPIVPATRATLLRLAKEHGWDTTSNARVLPGSYSHQTVVFGRLADYMVAKGWTRREKLHELRKLYATALCKAFGPYAAQLALGHAKLSTTTIYAARPEVEAIDPSALWLGAAAPGGESEVDFSI